MKSVITMMLALSLAVFGGQAAKTVAGDASEIVVAGVIFHDDFYMNMIQQGYVDAAKDAGVTCLTSRTDNNELREAKLIEEYVEQGVDGLAIAPIGSYSLGRLKRADAAGMKIALTNVNLENADFVVGSYVNDDYADAQRLGKQAAQMLKEQFGGRNVKIAVVQFKSLLPDLSGKRVNGFFDALDAAGIRYTIVADQDAWLQDTALAATERILEKPDLPDVFFAANDDAILGTVEGVEHAGLSKQVMVFGYDCNDTISKMLLNGDCPLRAVVARDPYSQGYQSMAALIRAIAGEDYAATKGKSVFVEGIVVSSHNKDDVNWWRMNNGLEIIE